MRNRNTNSRDSKSSRPSGDSPKTFRRASGKPEAESRFSKPSIKKSSLRAATAAPSDKPASFRPRAFGKDSGPKDFKPSGRDGQDKPGFDKPGFDKPRFDKPRFDKPGIGKPRFADRDNREFKPREGGSSERSRPFDNNNDRDSRSFKPRTDSNAEERPRRSDSDRNRSFERPQEGRSFKPRTDSHSEERPRRSDSDRTRSFERPQEGRSFKPRTDSNAEERPSRLNSSDRPQEGRSFRPRTESNSGDRPRRSDSDKPGFDKPRDGGSRDFKPSGERGRSEKPSFKKKDKSEELEENVTQEPTNIDEGANRRVGRFETAPHYKLGTYEKKAGIKKRKDENPELRLNRYIANAGICSRREADELIAAGEISVNGKVVTEMGHKVLKTDVVKYGKKILNPEKMVYVLINKPKDYITTTDDPEERKTVLDLIKGACDERIYPVGRLDRNTTGLLLMTNDGELAKKLTHPSGNVKKIYQAELDRAITNDDFEKLQHGLQLEDGFIRPDEIGIVTADAMVVGLEIHSGHNRIVRRMFEHLGYEVQKLDRTVFAGLDKKDLPRGKWRFLSEKEVIKLKYML